MLVEVSGLCATAKSDTLRPKRLPIHIGSAGERARPPVQSLIFVCYYQAKMNRTRRTSQSDRGHLWYCGVVMSGKVTCPQAVSRESHRTRNKNKQTTLAAHNI
jgi:hypothetical protein